MYPLSQISRWTWTFTGPWVAQQVVDFRKQRCPKVSAHPPSSTELRVLPSQSSLGPSSLFSKQLLPCPSHRHPCDWLFLLWVGPGPIPPGRTLLYLREAVTLRCHPPWRLHPLEGSVANLRAWAMLIVGVKGREGELEFRVPQWRLVFSNPDWRVQTSPKEQVGSGRSSGRDGLQLRRARHDEEGQPALAGP